MKRSKARKRVFRVAGTDDHAALVREFVPSHQARAFHEEYEDLAAEQDVTFFVHTLPSHSLPLEYRDRFFADIWLIHGSSRLLQFAIIERFVADAVLSSVPDPYLENLSCTTGIIFQRRCHFHEKI